MLLRMAWRNIWRKKRRTGITVVALAVGVCGITVMHSFGGAVWGTVVEMTASAFLGHLQVRARGYGDEPALYNTVPGTPALDASIREALPGAHVLPRVVGYGLVGGDEQSTDAMILGLLPEREREGSTLLTIREGRDLDADAAKEVVVGTELAERLDVGLGDELVLLGEAVDGSLANDLFTVVGLGEAGTHEMNGGAVFIHLDDAREFFVLGDGVHQVLVNLDGHPSDVSEPLGRLRRALDTERMEVLAWSDVAPELAAVVRQKRSGWYFMDFIVFVIVGLGVFNVMLMSTFERTHEFGVMASVGTRPRRILGLVLVEGLLQGAVGLAIGLALAFALLRTMGTVDLSALSEQDLMGFRMPKELTARASWTGVVAATVTVLVTTLVGALVPAWRASRLQPVDAMRARA